MNLIAHKRDGSGLPALPLRVNRRLDTLLDFGTGNGLASPAWTPPMDVLDTAEAIDVYLDLPGIDPKSADVSIQKDRLEVSGQREALETPGEARWYCFERPAGAFQRALTVRGERADRAGATRGTRVAPAASAWGGGSRNQRRKHA